MTAEEIEEYVRSLDLTVETVTVEGVEYTVVRDVTITTGGLAGKTCDVAFQRVHTVPWTPAAALHTKPALVAMDTNEPLATQASPLGADWQYWSRRYDRQPTPKDFWLHILTVLGDDRWTPA